MTERAPRELDPWQERYEEWTGLSHRLERFELFMAVFAQNLGRRDRDLNVREHEYARNRSKARAIEDSDAVTEAIADSDTVTELWLDGCMFVMCLYEVVRSIDERIAGDAELSSTSAAGVSKDTKHLFERVRIPLAKFQPAYRYRSTDYDVAQPGMSTDRSVSWEVADGIVISRRQLSDAFLELLRALPRRTVT